MKKSKKEEEEEEEEEERWEYSVEWTESTDVQCEDNEDEERKILP